ncbi:MAG: PVC-type heme-binding CxxCH protein [Planctomycetaceae bacterium]
MSHNVSKRLISSSPSAHKSSLPRLLLIGVCLAAAFGLFSDILQADEPKIPPVSATVPDSATVVDGIKVPDGFHVELYADDDLAHDVHSMTIDARGRVVVSGPGYIRILIDSNNDGRADTFKQFADKPDTGSQGMFFLGSSLLCSGDQGLQIFRDNNQDDVADGPPQVFLKISAGGEHHVHSIQKGPDGWWYVMAGNFAGVTAAYATVPTSPIRTPVSGTLLRLKPDLSGGEIVSDGFRNAYDFTFNGTGDFFTYDSDDERDISLPWYLPTQVFHVLPLSNAGYVTVGLKRPGSYPDMPPVLATFGRGSPTGVTCYQHQQFPEMYHGALFMLDWTLGRILTVPLIQEGAGWNKGGFVFAEGRDQFGFAPTDIEVAPDGSLFVSVGGRGTRGSVFRIVSDAPANPPVAARTDVGSQKLNSVLDAPQPNSSWSRATWIPLAISLGPDVFREAALRETRRVPERLRAIEILVEMFGGLDTVTASKLTLAGSSLVRARTAWAIGRSRPDSPEPEILRKLITDRDPFVQRFALEALTSATSDATFVVTAPSIAAALASDDRIVRLSAALLISRMNDDHRNAIAKALASNPRALMWFHMGRCLRSPLQSAPAAAVAADVLVSTTSSSEDRGDAARILQMTLGDVGPVKDRPVMFDGYAPRLPLASLEREINPVMTKVATAFPSGDANLDHELIRLIAMTTPFNRELFTRLLASITDSTLPADDIHRLAAISQFDIERSHDESVATAKALVGIDIKIRKYGLKQDTNWDDRIGELYKALCKVDPAMPTLLAEQPGFGEPGHVLFLTQVPQAAIPRAIEGLVKTIQSDPEYKWSNDVVFTIAESTQPEQLALLRAQLDNLSVRDSVLITIADKATKEDREILLSGLESPQLNAVEACLKALAKLPRSNAAAEQFQLLAAARRMMNDQREFQLREIAMRLLENNTSQAQQFVFGEVGYCLQPESMQLWQTWLEQRYPDYHPPQTSDVAQKVLLSLETVDWNAGNADNGRRLFERLACARCHGGRQALGPDLKGVTKRFSRHDLFASIVEPNRDISPRYQTTSIETKAGKVYTGLIVYESVDGLLLRDAEHRTYRIEASDMENKVLLRNSLMPAGLLKDTQPGDLADLDKYLQGL